jgi:hypothetical protein
MSRAVFQQFSLRSQSCARRFVTGQRYDESSFEDSIAMLDPATARRMTEKGLFFWQVVERVLFFAAKTYFEMQGLVATA